jgi:phage terminase small subunit
MHKGALIMLKKPELPPKAPKHLSKAASAWWAHVVEEYALEPHHQQLLLLACEAMDRGESARAALATHGEVYTDSHGNPRTRPEVAIERDSTIRFTRLVRELDLDTTPSDAPSGRRPPSLRSNRGGA